MLEKVRPVRLHDFFTSKHLTNMPRFLGYGVEERHPQQHLQQRTSSLQKPVRSWNRTRRIRKVSNRTLSYTKTTAFFWREMIYRCCACPETKRTRDECYLKADPSVADDTCREVVRAHIACMRRYGFEVWWGSVDVYLFAFVLVWCEGVGS